MMLSDVTSTDIITAIVALYGAGLSTVIAIREWRGRRPNIKVKVSLGLIDWVANVPRRYGLYIQVSNPGHKAVTLTSAGFILPGNTEYPIPQPLYFALPYELLPERLCKVSTYPGVLASDLNKRGFPSKVSLIGYCDDASGRRYKSKAAVFDTSTKLLAK